ncbi:MAG TPA: NAD(P)/FAD-dependent oxidoreductase [Burkholderiaceae bacterium]|nr:NAD(P)/FAD-dependent oxidoreductase [Burkholderiaceae bacterium]
MPANEQYDVAIVGASLSGCAAAIFFGRHGLKVALIERDTDPSAYKKICTHLIQSSATPTLQRLGLAGPIEAAGGVRQVLDIWTSWGWIGDTQEPADRPAYGYNLRREKLDPMVRRMAADTQGVDFIQGHSVKALVMKDRVAVGVETTSQSEAPRQILARLVVAADGRNSTLAQLAGAKTKVTPNARFTYSAYYKDLPMPKSSTSQIYFLDPDWASVLRTDDGLVMLGAMPTADKLPSWKGNIEEQFLKYFDAIPTAPSPRKGTRVSPFLGMLKMPMMSRPPVHSGIAFIGDAAMTADPLWGVGCGFAFQTAEWLFDAVSPALDGQESLARGLSFYARQHKKRLGGHEFVMKDYCSGRRYNHIETLMNSAGARDPVCASHIVAFGSRNTSLMQFMAPAAIARAAWVNTKHALGLGGGYRLDSPVPEKDLV